MTDGAPTVGWNTPRRSVVYPWVNNTALGFSREQLVRHLMTRFAWTAECSRASRGPRDVRARSGSNTLLLQVKTTRKPIVDAVGAEQHARHTVSTAAAKRLETAARYAKATAMVCVVSGAQLWMFVLRSGSYTPNYHTESILAVA